MWVAPHCVILAREQFRESVRLAKFPDRPFRRRTLAFLELARIIHDGSSRNR